MTLPTTNQIVPLLNAWLHADDDHAEETGLRLLELSVDADSWMILCGAIAIAAGEDLRSLAPTPQAGFYGLDAHAAARHDPAVVAANQIVAAAANRDKPLMHDILTAHLTAAETAGPNTTEQLLIAHLLTVTALLARTIHRATNCTDNQR